MTDYLRQALRSWTDLILSHPRPTLAALAVATLVVGYLAVAGFAINSDTDRLIRQDTEWKQHHEDFLASFPQYRDATFVVVSGKDRSAVLAVADDLERSLLQNPGFESVFRATNHPFYEEHGLLYVGNEELERMLEDLAVAAPLVASVAEDPSLRGLLGPLVTAFEVEQRVSGAFAPLLELLLEAVESTLEGTGQPANWRAQLTAIPVTGTTHDVLMVKGRKRFDEVLPNARIIEDIEAAAASIHHPSRSEVTIRLTGQLPLDHGEIVSAMESAQLAGTIALVVLVIVLVLGVRSLLVIAATYLTMVVGLIWTAAFANASVGQFNTISIAFLVMFIGLGVDFAIHLSLRYQEMLTRGDKKAALIEMNTGTGPTIALCALSSGVGFLAFVPTDYVGLAELGIISAGGMGIAFIASVTMIPAFFAVAREPGRRRGAALPEGFGAGLRHHRHRIAAATGLLAVGACFIAADVYFDYSTLSLKNPRSEEMEAFVDLQRGKIVTDYAIYYVAPNERAAISAKARLQGLETVGEVRIPTDYLPQPTPETLSTLTTAGDYLGYALERTDDPPEYTVSDRGRTIERLAATLAEYPSDGTIQPIVSQLHMGLRQIAAGPLSGMRGAALEAAVIPPLLDEIDWLRQALRPQSLQLTDLPDDIRERLISARGEWLVSVTPADDIVTVDALERFSAEVVTEVPGATGRPVIEVGIGGIVLDAFAIAVLVALGGTLLILIFSLRSALDSALVFVPLVLATIMTFAASVLTGLPLNMANVVVVPLIFGLGVDNGIHMVRRYRQDGFDGLFRSSTPTAVLLSTVTTICTFGALSFSTHRGIFSIGVLLTCALTFLLALTLVVLPVLLELTARVRSQST